VIDPPDDARRGAWPAIGAWVCVAAGLMLGREAGVVSVVWAVGAGAAALAAVAAALRGTGRARRAAVVCLGASAVLASAGWMRARVVEPAQRLPAVIEPAGGRALVEAEGVALDHPEHGPATPGAFSVFLDRAPVTRLRLAVRRLRDADGWRPATGVLYVRIGEAATGVRAGDRLRVEGVFLPMRGPSNPGEPDARLIAAQRGVVGRVLAPGRGNLEALPPPAGLLARAHARFLRLRADARASARGWLRDSISGLDRPGEPAPALLAALLLGERDDDALRDIDESMRRVGAAHLLSVSGLHLGVLVWMSVVAARAAGVRRGVESLAVAAVIALYLFVVPARTPIVRAGAGALAWLLADATGRRYNPLALLAWIGAGVLLWRPLDLWSAGYQLSFGVVAALVTLAPAVWLRWRPMVLAPDERTLGQTALMLLERLVIVAVVAWLVSSPILIFHFGVFSPLAAVASVALYPLVAAALGVGAAAVVLAAILPSAGLALGGVLTAIGRLVAGLTHALDALPGASITTPPVSVWWALAAEAVVLWLLARGRARSWRDRGLAALVVVWLAGFWFTPALPAGAVARLDTFAVGDGSAHLVRSRTGAALWDAGSSEFWLAQRDLPRAVRALGAWPVRSIVLTHPNLDHYSAIPDLIRPLGVRRVLIGRATASAARDDPDGPVAALIAAIERRGALVRLVGAGDTLAVGDLTLEFLHPPDGFVSRRANDQSLAARALAPTDAGPRVVLLTGDIQDRAIAALESAHPDLRADVLELPHHGSARPEAVRFVRRLGPRVVVQSTGPSRQDDERWDAARAGRVWLVTARDGAVSVTVRPDGAIEYRTLAGARGVVTAPAGTATGTAR